MLVSRIGIFRRPLLLNIQEFKKLQQFTNFEIKVGSHRDWSDRFVPGIETFNKLFLLKVFTTLKVFTPLKVFKNLRELLKL